MPIFPVVGVGASAGGLQAFTQFLANLRPNLGMAYILVQHLDRDRKSALPSLLAHSTKMPVVEATRGLALEPDHIYIGPPRALVTVSKGVLHLRARPKEPVPRSIDLLLESLAKDRGEAAIGVVLSGSGSDGAVGLEAIYSAGGITFAQDNSALFDSMPESAIRTGCVAFVLPPREIARRLGRIARHPYLGRAEGRQVEPQADGKPFLDRDARRDGGTKAPRGGMHRLFQLLHDRTGVDFRRYKQGTLRRRLERRMLLGNFQSLQAYTGELNRNAKEVRAVFSDFLISVTGFFRDPGAFELLKRREFPRLMRTTAGRPDTLRLWVAGCSTGQEAYSLAMAYAEARGRRPRAPALQIYATDLNEELLGVARAGFYPAAQMRGVSPQRLRRFFTREEGGYRIAKPLRDSVVFARHDLTRDPPFARMDLVSCRNVMIYFEPDLQQDVLRKFAYALNNQGCLFLGASEAPTLSDGFETVSRQHRLYRRKRGDASPRTPWQGRSPAPAPLWSTPPQQVPAPNHAQLTAQRTADRLILNRFAPSGVLIDEKFQIVQFRGDTSRWLKPPKGSASFDLWKMARAEAVDSIRAALARVLGKKAGAALPPRKGLAGAGPRVEVTPIRQQDARFWLVLFDPQRVAEEERVPDQAPVGPVQRGGQGNRASVLRIAGLEEELSELRDYHQSLQEQHDAAVSELRALNEEATSSNEEMQSVNEELVTSKEEIESSNEELRTLNDELGVRNAAIDRLNNDLVNLLNSSTIPIVLLSRDLRVQRFSSAAAAQFGLGAADVGRPFESIRHGLTAVNSHARSGAARKIARRKPEAPPGDEILALAARCLASVREVDTEVRDASGRWHSLRARPYVTVDNRVDGVVLVLIDTDPIKRSEMVMKAARDYAESVIDATPSPVVTLDESLRVESANKWFYRAFDTSPGETIGRRLAAVAKNRLDLPELQSLLESLEEGQIADNILVAKDLPADGRVAFNVSARAIVDPERGTRRVLLAVKDVSADESQRRAIAEARDFAEEILRTAPDPMLILSADLRVESANDSYYKAFHATPSETQGARIYDLGGGHWDLSRLRPLLEDLLPRNSFFQNLEVECDFPELGRRVLLVSGRALQQPEPKILLGIQDVTGLMHARMQGRADAERCAIVFDHNPVAKIIVDLESLRITDLNFAAADLLEVDRESGLGMDLAEVLPRPEDLVALRVGKPSEAKLQVRTRRGETVEVLANCYEAILSGAKVVLATLREIPR